MKIKTEDCVNAITNRIRLENMDKMGPITSSTDIQKHLAEMRHIGDLLDDRNWKRRAKYGNKTDKITREFENIVTGDKFYVYSTEDTILEIKPMVAPAPTEDEPYPEIAIDFKFKIVCDFGIIYTNSEYNRIRDNNIDPQEMQNSHYSKYTLKKGTRIGWFECGEGEVEGVLVATSDMNYYNYDSSMTSDGIITFEVSKDKKFIPAQEPSDCIENDDWDIEHATKLKGFVKKYKLDHLLLSM